MDHDTAFEKLAFHFVVNVCIVSVCVTFTIVNIIVTFNNMPLSVTVRGYPGHSAFSLTFT